MVIWLCIQLVNFQKTGLTNGNNEFLACLIVAGANQRRSRSITVSIPWTRPARNSPARTWCSTPWAATFWTMRSKVTTLAFSPTAKPVRRLITPSRVYLSRYDRNSPEKVCRIFTSRHFPIAAIKLEIFYKSIWA